MRIMQNNHMKLVDISLSPTMDEMAVIYQVRYRNFYADGEWQEYSYKDVIDLLKIRYDNSKGSRTLVYRDKEPYKQAPWDHYLGIEKGLIEKQQSSIRNKTAIELEESMGPEFTSPMKKRLNDQINLNTSMDPRVIQNFQKLKEYRCVPSRYRKIIYNDKETFSALYVDKDDYNKDIIEVKWFNANRMNYNLNETACDLISPCTGVSNLGHSVIMPFSLNFCSNNQKLNVASWFTDVHTGKPVMKNFLYTMPKYKDKKGDLQAITHHDEILENHVNFKKSHFKPGPGNLRFEMSPDGYKLLVAEDPSIYMWRQLDSMLQEYKNFADGIKKPEVKEEDNNDWVLDWAIGRRNLVFSSMTIDRVLFTKADKKIMDDFIEMDKKK